MMFAQRDYEIDTKVIRRDMRRKLVHDKSEIKSHAISSTGEYWWLYCFYRGQLVIEGWFSTEEEANNWGINNLPVHFEVVKLNTSSEPRATQNIKAILHGETGDIDQAIQKARHKGEDLPPAMNE